MHLDNILTSKVTYDRDFFKVLTWESYHKGKLRFKHEYSYNLSGKKTGYKSFWGKEKVKAHTDNASQPDGEQWQ